MSGSLSKKCIEDAARNPDLTEEALVALCSTIDERIAILAKQRELQAFYNKLDHLASCGSMDELKAHIKKREDIDLDSNLSGRCRTALTSAILSLNTEKSSVEVACAKVDYLISLGADVNKLSPVGNFPLEDAISTGSVDIVNRLLEAGANVNFKNKISNLTPLFRSILIGDASIFFRLLEKGADLHYPAFHEDLACILSRDRKSPEFVHNVLAQRKRILSPSEIDFLVQQTHHIYLEGVNIIKEMIIKYGDPDEKAALRESLSRVNYSRDIKTPTRDILTLDSYSLDDPAWCKNK